MHRADRPTLPPRPFLRHRRRCWGALALALAVLAGMACVTRSLVPRETGRLFLWEVESRHPGGGEAHLLGSVHLGKAGHRFDPAIEAAFDEADALVVEVDLLALGGEDAGRLLTSMGGLEGDRRLEDLLSPTSWKRFAELLERNGQSAESYQQLEPWVAFTVATTLLIEEGELSSSNGVDRYFLGRAGSRIEIIPLETLEFQLSLFDSLPLELQLTMLDDLLAEGRAVAREAETLVDAWRLGDTEAMERMITAPFDEEPGLDQLRKRLFDQRNRSMSQRIDELLREDRRLFVVLGAGHMVGFQGIPTLLEGRGHQVSQIPKSH